MGGIYVGCLTSKADEVMAIGHDDEIDRSCRESRPDRTAELATPANGTGAR